MASESNSGIQGMRVTLSLALDHLKRRDAAGAVRGFEWAQLAAKYAELAELEHRIGAEPTDTQASVSTQRILGHDGIPGGPASAWAEFLPWRVIRDVDEDLYVVVAYTHNGAPILATMETAHRYGRKTLWAGRHADSVAQDYGPLVVTDRYLTA